jgi:hypothetical protein
LASSRCLLAGGFALFVQINGVTTEVNKVRTELTARLDKLENAVADLKGGQTTANGALSRIERRLAETQQATPPLGLTADQIALLHQYLKLDPNLAYSGIGRQGDVLQDAKLYDYPSGVVDKIPALKGTQYTFDIKGQILIVSSADRRIVAVV